MAYLLSNTFTKNYWNPTNCSNYRWWLGGILFWDTVYIHFWWLLPPNGIVPGAKFTLRPSHPLSYIGSVTARHSSSGRQPNFAAWDKENCWEWRAVFLHTYIRRGGHHVLLPCHIF